MSKILDKDQLTIIKHYLKEVENCLNYINDLKNIKTYLIVFFERKKIEEYEQLSKYINTLEDNNLKLKEDEKYKKNLNNFINNYKEKSNDTKYLKSSIFIKIFDSIKKLEEDEEKCLEQTKKKFAKVKKLFENIQIEEKMEDKNIKEFFSIKDRNDIYKEITILNNIFETKREENDVGKLVDEIITYKSYSIVKKIVKGLIILFDNFIIDKNDDIKNIYEDLNNINKKRSLTDINQKIEFLKKEYDIDITEINQNEKNQKENKLFHFLKLLIKFPDAIQWIKSQKENNLIFNL